MIRGLAHATHRADVLGKWMFIDLSSPEDSDQALDVEKLNSEAKELAAAHAAEQKRAEEAGEEPDFRGLTASDHPVIRYGLGFSRYQLDAEDYFLGAPRTMRDYLKPDVKPTLFTLRHLSRAQYRACDAIDNTHDRLIAFAKAGCVAIEGPDFSWSEDNGGGATTRPNSNGLPDDVIELLWNADHRLPPELGFAVIRFNAPLSAGEKKVHPYRRVGAGTSTG